jgi:transposase-like protein
MRRSRFRPPVDLGCSAFSGHRFPPEVIVLAVRWYLRYGLSYLDLEELLAERGVEVDHVTLFRWVQRFAPLLVDAARPCRHAVSGRWFVDETYVKVSGVWRYVYRAVDDQGQVIDVYVSARRDIAAARRFFTAAITAHGTPDEVVTDLAQALETVIEELVPDAFHNTSSTRITGSNATTAVSRPDCDQCAASRPTAPPRSSSPGTRSCRTSAAATTNSAPRRSRACVSPRHFPNLPRRSDHETPGSTPRRGI